MYALARKRGVTHEEVLGFIEKEYGVESSLKLNIEQIDRVRAVLRVLQVVDKSKRPPVVHKVHEWRKECQNQE